MPLQKPLFSRRLFLVLAVAVVVFGAVVSYRVYQRERSEAIANAAETLQVSMTAFVGALGQVFEPAIVLGETVDKAFLWRAQDDAEIARLFFAAATGPVSQFGQVNGAFIGFPDGRFLHVQDIRVSSSKMQGQRRGQGVRRRSILSPEEDPVGTWEVFSNTSKSWLPEATSAEPYDPRERPWYKGAVSLGAPIWSDAYIFSSSGQPGVTYARPIYDGEGHLWAVMGVDLTLSALSKVLVSTIDMLSQSHDVVFATDFAEKILGHPDLFLQVQGAAATGVAGNARYDADNSIEREIIHRVREQGRAVTFVYKGATFLAVKGLLDTAKAMPLQVYVGRDVKTLLHEAREAMLARVLIVFGAVSILGLILLYAIKLRVEVKARKQAETALVAAKDAAEAATKAKSTFLATMSHEIRTPMNGVLSMVELLSLSRLDTEQRRMTRIISDSANALLAILNDILDMSKIEAGKIEIESVPFSLSQLVDGAAELLASRADDGGILLIAGMDPALPDTRLGDPTRLRQVLLNLASNALKFTEEGQVEIKVYDAEAADRIRFEVHDTGIGLTEDQREKLFQAFVQADASTSRRFGGTGLGLSISQKLCELMGGTIGVDSEPGIGSCFWFEIPLPAENDDCLEPKFDLTALRYRMGALPSSVSAILTRYLEAGGVKPASDAEWATGKVDILFLADVTADAAETVRGFEEGSADNRRLCLVGPRTLLQSLDSGAASLHPIMLATPFSRSSAWHAAAVALGLELEEEADRNANLEFAPPETETARADQALILVAEDNETNRIVAGQMLSRMGYACEMAENGAVALQMWRERGGYGLLLSDLNMPEMDGLDLSKAIRDAEEDAGSDMRLPIIALTADVLSEAAEACRAAGMDDVLLKPIDSGKLAEAIARLMPQGAALRRIGEIDTAEDAESSDAEEAWDAEILDLSVLTEAFGGFSDDAWNLVRTAPDLWETRISEITAALAAGDLPSARNAAHSLKGVALSLGANRMGRIASDIQDALDADSAEFAEMLAEVLLPTLEEFKLVVGQIELSRSDSGTR